MAYMSTPWKRSFRCLHAAPARASTPYDLRRTARCVEQAYGRRSGTSEVAMEQLTVTDRDVQQMLAITRAYAADDGAALPWEMLEDLRRLVPCDFLEASGQDTPSWSFFAEQQVFDEGRIQAGDRGTMASDEDSDLYKLFYWDSPCSYPDRGDISLAVRSSDIETWHEQLNSGFVAEMMKPDRIDYELILALDAGAPQRTLRLL